MNTPNMAQTLQGLKTYYHHDCCTVRVGNDATRTVQSILGVALRNDQRHICIHTEGTTIVNHHASILRNGLCKVLAGSATGTHKSYVNILEVVIMLQKLHLIFLSTELIFASGTAFAAKQYEVVHRELAFVKNTQKFLPYGAAGAHNCYSHLLICLCLY